jgi:hypothetical protein
MPGPASRRSGEPRHSPGALPHRPGNSARHPGSLSKRPGVLAQAPGESGQEPGTMPRNSGALAEISGAMAQSPGTSPKKPGTNFGDVVLVPKIAEVFEPQPSAFSQALPRDLYALEKPRVLLQFEVGPIFLRSEADEDSGRPFSPYDIIEHAELVDSQPVLGLSHPSKPLDPAFTELSLVHAGGESPSHP